MTVRTITVRERVLARNDAIAAEVRARLAGAGVRAVNMVSSPGAGKTLLLERTLAGLGGEIPLALVAGDVQTQNDADRLARHTDRLVQAVVTGGACHLDASQVAEAIDALDLSAIRLLVIENVGNLVCPAAWDLGEDLRVVLFAVTEGEDKPLKYPRMFETAHVALLTKVDLLPHVPFEEARAREAMHRVNPGLEVVALSALTGAGMDGWHGVLRRLAGQPAVRT